MSDGILTINNLLGDGKPGRQTPVSQASNHSCFFRPLFFLEGVMTKNGRLREWQRVEDMEDEKVIPTDTLNKLIYGYGEEEDDNKDMEI